MMTGDHTGSHTHTAKQAKNSGCAVVGQRSAPGVVKRRLLASDGAQVEHEQPPATR